MKKLLVAAAIAVLGVGMSGQVAAGGDHDQASEKSAQCEITSGAIVEYKGECVFAAEPGGSFSLSKSKEAPLYPGILVVSVTLVDEGVAEVRGLTTDGINSRWGEAKRSTDDGACWIGSDFKVCAR